MEDVLQAVKLAQVVLEHRKQVSRTRVEIHLLLLLSSKKSTNRLALTVPESRLILEILVNTNCKDLNNWNVESGLVSMLIGSK